MKRLAAVALLALAPALGFAQSTWILEPTHTHASQPRGFPAPRPRPNVASTPVRIVNRCVRRSIPTGVHARAVERPW